jgi:hypothetical protein
LFQLKASAGQALKIEFYSVKPMARLAFPAVTIKEGRGHFFRDFSRDRDEKLSLLEKLDRGGTS